MVGVAPKWEMIRNYWVPIPWLAASTRIAFDSTVVFIS